MKTRTNASTARPGPITMSAGLNLYNVLDDELEEHDLEWAELAALGIRERPPGEAWA